MLIRSLVTAASVAIAGSMAHAQTGPRVSSGGSGPRNPTVTITTATTTAVRTVAPGINVAPIVNGAIAPYAANSTFNAGRVSNAVEAVAVSFQRKLSAGTALTNAQKDGVEAAIKFVAIAAAAGDTAYTQLVQRFIANGVVGTILAGEDDKGELTNAVAFLKAASTQERSMDAAALKAHVDGLVRTMMRDPANPTAQLSGLEDAAFNPSDCFANAAG